MNERSAADEELFVEAPDGRIAFTAEGREFYTSYFGYGGIDIRRIQTREDLYQASRVAFPLFFQYMEQRLEKRQQSLETRALLAIVRSDWASLDRIERQLKTRQRLEVLSASRDGHPVRA